MCLIAHGKFNKEIFYKFSTSCKSNFFYKELG